MSYKINLDPITGKLRSCTKIQSNIPVYDDDIIAEDGEIAEILASCTCEASSDDYESAVQALNTEIKTLAEEDEKDYLVRLLVDEGKSLAKAREEITQRREKLSALQNELDAKVEEHKEAVHRFYLAKDAESDAAAEYAYYSSIILLIKDENRYLKEWIDWHNNLAFEHFYIYDNGSNEKVSQVISEYPEEMQEKFTVIDWSGHHEHIQQDAYNHFLANYKAQTRWGLAIDSDEFVRFTDAAITDVNDFLKSYEDYTEIWGYEIEYNANGQEEYEDKPVRERFTKTTNVRDGYFWKNFVQVNRISSYKMHYAQYNSQKHFLFKNEEQNKNLFVIDHYYTKSWEEWQWKIKERGGADPNYHKVLQEFFFYNPDMEYLNTGENAAQAYE